MQNSLKVFASLFVATAAVSASASTPESAPPVTELTTQRILLDATTAEAFKNLGDSNWRMEDGAMVADAGTAPSYLVSTERFADFSLHVEFYASADANSGVFIRCQEPGRITDTNCYEVNIFDQRPDPSYSTGAIVRHVEVGTSSSSGAPKAGGRWNTFEITAIGRDITVVLNGEVTARLRSGLFTQGHIALQHAAGVIKFRKMVLKPVGE
ncbi:MAG: DUF1080 domain-containing protein [Pseudomonadota bacterium]